MPMPNLKHMRRQLRRILIAIPFLFLAKTSQARWIAAELGFGKFFSDSFETSYLLGGGVLVRPWVDWLELSMTYDRVLVKVADSHPLYPVLDDKWIGLGKFGVTFPISLEAWSLPSILYGMIGYVVAHVDSSITHGIALGGGMEFIVWRDIIGLRFELRDLIYQIPHGNSRTPEQGDLQFLLRLVAGL